MGDVGEHRPASSYRNLAVSHEPSRFDEWGASWVCWLLRWMILLRTWRSSPSLEMRLLDVAAVRLARLHYISQALSATDPMSTLLGSARFVPSALAA